MQKSREFEVYKNGMWSDYRFDQLQEGDIFRACGPAEHIWRVAHRGGFSVEVEPFLGAEHLGELRKQMGVELNYVEHGSVGIESVTLDQEIGDARFYTIRTRDRVVVCGTSTFYNDAGAFSEIDIGAHREGNDDHRARVGFQVSGVDDAATVAAVVGHRVIQVVIWRADICDEVVLYEQEDDQ